MGFKIRIACRDDGPRIAEIYAPIVRDTVISFETDPPSADEMVMRLDSILTTHPWLVVEVEGQVMAYAYASPHRSRDAYRWSSDVSVYVAEAGRGRGMARALYGQLFSILTQQGMASIYAGITLPNEASVGLHESFGFQPVGVYPNVGFKMGAWHNVGWWSRPLQTLGCEPKLPIPFAKIREQIKLT